MKSKQYFQPLGIVHVFVPLGILSSRFGNLLKILSMLLLVCRMTIHKEKKREWSQGKCFTLLRQRQNPRSDRICTERIH